MDYQLVATIRGGSQFIQRGAEHSLPRRLLASFIALLVAVSLYSGGPWMTPGELAENSLVG